MKQGKQYSTSYIEQRDDLTTSEKISSVCLFVVFIIMFIFLVKTARKKSVWKRKTKALKATDRFIIMLIVTEIVTRAFQMTDAFAVFTQKPKNHYIPIYGIFFCNALSLFSLTQLSLVYSYLWLKISILIFEDEKNRKKRFQGCVSAFIVLNFFKITSEMVLCYMNQYPYALWMAFFTTLLTVVVITVSAMIFYKTIGSCFCGSYIVNVKKNIISIILCFTVRCVYNLGKILFYQEYREMRLYAYYHDTLPFGIFTFLYIVISDIIPTIMFIKNLEYFSKNTVVLSPKTVSVRPSLGSSGSGSQPTASAKAPEKTGQSAVKKSVVMKTPTLSTKMKVSKFEFDDSLIGDYS